MVFGAEPNNNITVTLWKFLAAGFVIITGAESTEKRARQQITRCWGEICRHIDRCKESSRSAINKAERAYDLQVNTKRIERLSACRRGVRAAGWVNKGVEGKPEYLHQGRNSKPTANCAAQAWHTRWRMPSARSSKASRRTCCWIWG